MVGGEGRTESVVKTEGVNGVETRRCIGRGIDWKKGEGPRGGGVFDRESEDLVLRGGGGGGGSG